MIYIIIIIQFLSYVLHSFMYHLYYHHHHYYYCHRHSSQNHSFINTSQSLVAFKSFGSSTNSQTLSKPSHLGHQTVAKAKGDVSVGVDKSDGFDVRCDCDFGRGLLPYRCTGTCLLLFDEHEDEPREP
jgi:hypothetical protein